MNYYKEIERQSSEVQNTLLRSKSISSIGPYAVDNSHFKGNFETEIGLNFPLNSKKDPENEKQPFEKPKFGVIPKKNQSFLIRKPVSS